MIQLRALNDGIADNSNYESDDYEITGEAEESIVISEYKRALKLKDAKKYKAALGLFLELLETDALAKVSHTNKNDQILLVKYNCYRNVGFMFKEKGQNEKALYYLIKATEIDRSDIHTLFYLAQLAHCLGREQIALICYEKCIEYNFKHWPSAEGILKLLCFTKNIVDVYFWARRCLELDPSYANAIDTLRAIRYQFSKNIFFLEKMYGTVLENDSELYEKVPHNHLFCSGNQLHNSAIKCARLMNDSIAIERINLDWISIANFIINLQDNTIVLYQEKQVIESDIEATEFVTDHSISEKEVQSASSLRNETGTLEDADTKNRRRDTELKILEQWGWHKSKRTLRKKTSHDPSDPNDSTADGFIRRTLSHHFVVCYDSDTSPFSGKKYDSELENLHQRKTIPASDFLISSKQALINLIKHIKESNDSFTMAVQYACNLSKFWMLAIPEEICTTYRYLYKSFFLYENNHSWFNSSSVEVISQIQMTLFYLELEYDFLVNTGNVKSVSGEMYRKMLTSLHLYISLLEDSVEDYVIFQSRYLWLNYIFAINEGDLYTALMKLQQLLLLISGQTQVIDVIIPNVSYTNHFSILSVKKCIESLELRINMRYIESLYKTGAYEEVKQILIRCLNESSVNQLQYNYGLDQHAQIEILLESLWRLDSFHGCIEWAEKILKYATDNFFGHSKGFSNRTGFANMINTTLLYIHELIEKLGFEILEFEYISRMIQSIHKILTSLLDVQIDKNSSNNHIIDCWRGWIILHYVLEWENDRIVIDRKKKLSQDCIIVPDSQEDTMFSSTMIFFIAHELLGRRQWCSKGNQQFLLKILKATVPKLRSPLFEPYRDIIQECLEQTTHCLYGFPQKKARMRHIQDHETTAMDITWPEAVQLLDIFRPDVLPQFNSYKIDSISADMETLLQQCISTMPNNNVMLMHTKPIDDFINGKTCFLPMSFTNETIQFKIDWIYYLLADYYFKCRDFSKAIQYYKIDLVVDPTRFDSWAGISLSKASKCETMIGSPGVHSPEDFLKKADDTLKCFEMCLKINENDPQLWVENGSFAYNIQSYCSRYLKSHLALPKICTYVKLQLDKYNKIVHKCFNRVINQSLCKDKYNNTGYEDRDDEQWLYHYMLGKIFEKDRGDPLVYLTHYFKSSLCLYESNATYPIKISHSNPSQLSIEALELFYRTNAAIIKYVERNPCIKQSTGTFFMQILKKLAVCPFAVNRAKINEVLLKKHKFTEEQTKLTCAKLYCSQNKDDAMRNLSKDALTEGNRIDTKSNTSNSSCSSSSDSETVQEMSSDSGSSCTNLNENFINSDLRDALFYESLKNLEECATRFPEHYKSLYRLAYHYMYSPGSTKSHEKSYQLLLGSYKTTLGAKIQGLFAERRSNNFFNGIWRIPSSDIDRPGSFEAHLCKCICLLINVLSTMNDHETILELAVHLYKTPETDKKYLNENDRQMLFESAVSCCVDVLKYKLKEVSAGKDDKLKSLMIDIFKVYRKSVKHIQEKEKVFSDLLVESYMVYVNERVALPANANPLDLAVKLCSYEINYRKTKDKLETNSKQIEVTLPNTISLQHASSTFVPGLTKLKKVTVNHSTNNILPLSTDSVVQQNLPPIKFELTRIQGKVQTNMKEKNFPVLKNNISRENTDLSRICASLSTT